MKHVLLSCVPFLIIGCGTQGSSAPGNASGEAGPAVKIELVQEVGAKTPRAIRLTFENASERALSFQEPAPMCPTEMRVETARLALVLTDAGGRESRWTPVLTEHFQANLGDPRERTLAPGESWSESYALDRLYFWGPCGPAAPISEFLLPDGEGIQVSVVVVSSKTSAIRSRPIRIPYTVASWIFDEPGRASGNAEAARDRSAGEEAFAREERRRRVSALQAARRAFAAKEPEHAGKPISQWLDEYCDPRSLLADEGSPLAARRAQAMEAVLEMRAHAVPFLMKALEIEYDLSDCAADLLGKLYEAGQVSDQALVETLKSESEQARAGVLKALEPADSFSPRQKARSLSPQLVEALVEVLKDDELLLERYLVPKALGRPGLKVAVPALKEALKDSEAAVRTGAAQALAAIGPEAKESIPALKAMAQSSDKVEKRIARSSLIALGESPADPMDFHERMGVYYHGRLAKESLKEGSESALESVPSGADGVFFVVDRSGTSLGGFRLAQRYIPRVLSALAEDSEFGIVFVDHGELSYPEGGKPAKAGKGERAAGLGFVLRTERGSGSCPMAGFDAALDFVDASSARRKLIVYIGDGGGTCMGADEAQYLERMCNEVTRRNAGRAEIHAIGVGAGKLGEAVLLYLSEQNGGTYTRLVTE